MDDKMVSAITVFSLISMQRIEVSSDILIELLIYKLIIDCQFQKVVIWEDSMKKKYTYTDDFWESACRRRQNRNARTACVRLTSGQGRSTSYVCICLAHKSSTRHNISGVPFSPRRDTKNPKRHTLQKNKTSWLSSLISSSSLSQSFAF